MMTWRLTLHRRYVPTILPLDRRRLACPPVAVAVDEAVTTREQLTHRFAKLAARCAVDEEVDRIAERDEDVDEERGAELSLVADDVHSKRIVYHHQSEDDHQGKLDQQEDADDNHQHERRSVAGRQVATLGPANAASHQLITALLCGPHVPNEEHVHDDERGARNQVNRYDAETQDWIVVDVLVLSEPLVAPPDAADEDICSGRGYI